MTAANFNACLSITLTEEGGFVDNPDDPGGITNLGVTQRTWSDWIGHQASVAEMRALTGQQVAPLYQQRYWEPTGCDTWAPGVDLSVFDFGVNAGPQRAVKALQEAASVTADGVIGPHTIAAVGAANAAELIIRFSDLREAYYRSLPGFVHFGTGWLNRVAYVRKRALDMVTA